MAVRGRHCLGTSRTRIQWSGWPLYACPPSVDQRGAILDAFMGYMSTFFHTHQRHAERRARPVLQSRPQTATTFTHELHPRHAHSTKRYFHNYFVTHLLPSSLHPDSRPNNGRHHKLPRSISTPHRQSAAAPPAASPPDMSSRDLTVVRIPLRSAKHHFGAYNARGQRPYNEDTNQAGTIDVPAFAKRTRGSFVRKPIAKPAGKSISAESASADPQIFYFSVFDGHGGSQCSDFLRDELHGYIEEAASAFGLESTLPNARVRQKDRVRTVVPGPSLESLQAKRKALDQVVMKSAHQVEGELELPRMPTMDSHAPVPANANVSKAFQLVKALVEEYGNTIGGYFRRFRPTHLGLIPCSSTCPDREQAQTAVSLESVLEYAFLRADLDFVTAQARKPDPDDPRLSDFPLNQDEILGRPHLPPSGHGIGGSTRFKGGSTASVALISTPTPAPFWHPAAHSTLLVAHVGDTRVLLCDTATGLARPLTRDHHPSSPTEARRLTRYAESLVTDSFGEERIAGLANSRAFGDMQSKRIGVSAEPDISRVDMGPAEYAFLVLVSDGVSGTLPDQEIVDVIKEARTPEEGARQVVDYATEISADGDNATCLVVRLGGWERRSEGGVGSLGTKEIRDARRNEAMDPRRGRQ